ncbi:DUF47 domain-containing protein [Clostridium polynesiense]|uniref:DUF47 domain-containing protein n=1 Tax=Clostridium polynesiense TaxID=1325933 RepID=UPI00058C957C|nr:DUF47 family protein [Clostridium polynesiense]
MAIKRGNDYYGMFVELVEFSCSAASMLHNTLLNFSTEALPSKIEEIHKIEHAADIKKHEMMEKLAKEFITPIEREDIILLSQEIDDVTDTIEDVLIKIFMFNISSIRKEALDFTSAIVKCTGELKKVMEEFRNFRKSKTIHQSIILVNDLEEECDKLYTDGVRSLYVNSKEPVELMTWTEIFDRLERCSDACEHVANAVESIIMKNS